MLIAYLIVMSILLSYVGYHSLYVPYISKKARVLRFAEKAMKELNNIPAPPPKLLVISSKPENSKNNLVSLSEYRAKKLKNPKVK